MDPETFSELYRAHCRRVLAYTLRRTGPDEAREATDEAFLVAWRRRADIPATVLPWLLGVARNILSDQRRQRARYDALQAEISACAQREQLGVDLDVIERLSVLRALAALNDRDREVLMLTAWDGLAPKDAARVLGTSTTAFAVRPHRARRRLAVAMTAIDRQAMSQPTTRLVGSTELLGGHS